LTLNVASWRVQSKSRNELGESPVGQAFIIAIRAIREKKGTEKFRLRRTQCLLATLDESV
jgi:hypothetical protein